MSTLTSYFASRSTQAAAPAPVLYTVDTDAIIRQAWQLSLEEWDALNNTERANLRWNLTKAPDFKP